MGSILYLHIEDFNDPLYLWVSAAAADVEPPIGRAESRGVASITGELGALDAMEHGGEAEELELGRSGGEES